MTVYAYYLVGDNRGTFDVPRLYAFTNDKSIANDFEKVRDMSMFIMQKKHIDKDKYKGYCDTHKWHLLGRRKYPSRGYGLDKETVCEIISTIVEEELVYIKSDRFIYEIGKYVSEDTERLTKEYKKALKNIWYYNVWDFVFNIYNPKTKKHADFNYKVDMAALFVYFYGYTMSND